MCLNFQLPFMPKVYLFIYLPTYLFCFSSPIRGFVANVSEGMYLFQKFLLVTCKLLGKECVCAHTHIHTLIHTYICTLQTVKPHKEENNFPKGHRPFLSIGHKLSSLFTLSYIVVLCPFFKPPLFYTDFQAICWK